MKKISAFDYYTTPFLLFMAWVIIAVKSDNYWFFWLVAITWAINGLIRIAKNLEYDD